MTGTKIIKIFLASSSELKDDREQFEIFINRKNKEYIKKGIFIYLELWEDFLDAMSSTRLQDEYNKAITDCHVFIGLFHTKVGQYTEEEFLKAVETFKANQKPIIYTYFKDSPTKITPEVVSVIDFQKKLEQLGHFKTEYNDINDLKYKFSEQLTKFIPKLVIKIEPDFQQEQQELEQALQSQIQQLEQQLEQERSQASEQQSRLQSSLAEKESIISQLQEQIQITPKMFSIELGSERGVDYTKLRDLLAARDWQEADQETNRLMLNLIGKNDWSNITSQDIDNFDNFPCRDLLSIEKLWKTASQGKFCFQTQKYIYLIVFMEYSRRPSKYARDIWNEYCDRIGWRRDQGWVSYNDMIFDLNAPDGHLPGGIRYIPMETRYETARDLIQAIGRKLRDCGIDTISRND